MTDKRRALQRIEELEAQIYAVEREMERTPVEKLLPLLAKFSELRLEIERIERMILKLSEGNEVRDSGARHG